MTDILNLSVSKYGNVNFSINIYAAVGICIVFFLLKWCIQKYRKKGFRQIGVDAMNLGNQFEKQMTSKYSRKERELAYKIWFEMESNSIGQAYEEDSSVIAQIHDTWSEFMRFTRGLIQNAPAETLKHRLSENNLATLCITRLNGDLKPYLDHWQEKYKKWYENAEVQEDNVSLTSQELQRKYDDYEKLTADLNKTNVEIVRLKDLLYGIAFHM